MNKKRLLILSHAMELGGAERSLLGLLDALKESEYEVDLFLLRHEGDLLKYIPGHVRLLPEEPAYTVLARPMKTVLKEGHVLLTAARLFARQKARLFAKQNHLKDSIVSLEYSHKYTCPFMPRIQPDVEYDLAISYLTPHYFIAEKVRSKRKFAWIHTDYSQVSLDVKSETQMWGKYDQIVSISEAVSKSFLSVFPGLKDKLFEMENALPCRLILEQAEAFSGETEMPQFEGANLLSIGRYCHAKNFDNVPDICRRMVALGANIKWYIIGFGGDEALIQTKIKEAGMEDRVILLGKKENPYPYIKACDLYVQPSRYEGKAITVKEAQLLGKPVAITNYPTANSQLQNEIDGLIVPMDNQKCAEELCNLLKNDDLMAQLTDNCRKCSDNCSTRLLELLGE